MKSNLRFFLLNGLFVSFCQSGCRQFHNVVPNAEKDLSFTCNLDLRRDLSIDLFIHCSHFQKSTLSLTVALLSKLNDNETSYKTWRVINLACKHWNYQVARHGNIKLRANYSMREFQGSSSCGCMWRVGNLILISWIDQLIIIRKLSFNSHTTLWGGSTRQQVELRFYSTLDSSLVL